MSRRTEDITCPTIANIYTHVSNLTKVTSELSTNTQELTTKLLDFQMNQEKTNTEFLTILDKIQNQIKKLENSKYSTELDHKLSQIVDTIGEKITKDVEVIDSDMTGFVDEVVNKAFDKVMSEINKSTEKALNEVKDDDDNYIDKDAEEAHYLPVLREQIHIKINQHLDWAKNKQKRKFSIAKDIGREYIYNLEETPVAPHNRDVTEEYVKFFLRELKKNLKTYSNPSKLQENVIALCHSQHRCRASELTFLHPFKDVLKILQIDCTSPEISEDEAEASSKKRGRKKLHVSEMAFRSKEAIHIIKQIDHAIRVDKSGKRSSATKIPKFKINKLPPWAVCRGAIRTSSSASGFSSSDLAITLEI
ncbi:13680_t:CDS:2 [Dentiscutata erythropus]|uniref:13680_t:CDS:1 n=1 Tax=Dentiscutata erythropus TaxID=1348616 RepID=A0A9N8ZY39_9GLOM|nr:13680_t:CDS:2 [Dentiscutata erythropus]